jgi:hypothetical protein
MQGAAPAGFAAEQALKAAIEQSALASPGAEMRRIEKATLKSGVFETEGLTPLG